MRLRIGDVDVAEYVPDRDVAAMLGARPYLHPVRTLGGVTVTEALPYDHPWHLGVSLAMQDVAGVNLWGGRTYVRGKGYTWRDDHGRIAHAGWLPAAEGFAERLDWLDPAGKPLLAEQRWVTARPAEHGWQLSFAYTLTAPEGCDVPLGSPATNGRPDGAGYGGLFWRAAPGAAAAFTAEHDGERAVNGGAEPWLAVTGTTLGSESSQPGTYTLVFQGLADADRWFVRTGEYVGVCAALAFERPLVVAGGSTVSRRLTVLVADGQLSREQVRAYAQE